MSARAASREERPEPDLDRRRPGSSRFTTQRREDDRVRILSGVFEGVTTGTPIGLLIENLQPALEGLQRDSGHVPAESRGLHVHAEIRNA